MESEEKQPQEINQLPQGGSFVRAYIAVFIVVVVLAAVLYWGHGFVRSLAEKSGVEEDAKIAVQLNVALQQGYKGDFRGSLESAQRIVSGLEATSSLQSQRAITTLATNYFWTGEMEKRLEAVRLTKKQFINEPGSKRNQSFLINRLIGYMTSAMEPEVIAEVFKGEPFQRFYDPASDTDSIFRNLALESLSRYRTSAAYARVGIWHAGKLFKHHDDIEKLSGDQLNQSVLGVQEYLTKMNSVLERELEADILYKQLAEAQFYYYQGFLYGALALTDTKFFSDMKRSFDRVHAEYSSEKDQDGGSIAFIETRIIYSDFARATYTDAIVGNERKAEIEADLQEMIDLMQAHPEVHRGGFLAFMHQTMTDGPEKTAGRWYSYDRFVRMAEVYAPFKKFLQENGWDLK